MAKYVYEPGKRRHHRDLGTEWPGGGSVSGGGKDFFHLQIFKTSCGTQSASYSIATAFFPEGKRPVHAFGHSASSCTKVTVEWGCTSASLYIFM